MGRAFQPDIHTPSDRPGNFSVVARAPFITLRRACAAQQHGKSYIVSHRVHPHWG
jgi:hypothetical protein